MIYKTYNSNEYLNELNKRISARKRGDNVVLVSMSFDPDDKKIEFLVKNLCRAAKRGVRVVLVIDAFSFLSGRGVLPGPFFFKKNLDGKLPDNFHRKLTSLNQLKSSGGQYIITNIPQKKYNLPFVGRSHIKLGLINDTVFLGSFNLDSSKTTDLMIKIENPKVSATLNELITGLEVRGNVRAVLKGVDKTIPIDKDSKIIIDSGVKHQSTILNEAYRIIDTAKEEVYFTCQYFPNGKTIKKLVEAKNRGVKVTLVYNTPLVRKYPGKILHVLVKKYYKLKVPADLFGNEIGLDQPFLHSKILAADSGSIIGSHNMIEAGVKFGTAEIALLSKDTNLTKAIRGAVVLINQHNML